MKGADVRASHWNTLRRRAADVLEMVFGPDPGLLRLRMAARTVISAAITLTALLLMFGGQGLAAAAPIALGFMVSIFSNMTVRDPTAIRQAVTLVLLVLPALGSVALASFLSAWQWAADICFVATVSGAALARSAGPRGMAMGMVAFIGYFIGVVIHPPLAAMPQLSAAAAIGIAAAAATRFVLLRDDPPAALRQVKRHLSRRIGRILALADELLARKPPAGSDAGAQTEAANRRAHYEIARLNDALLVAQDQIEAAEHRSDDESRRLSNRLFRLELAAERLMRMAAWHRDPPTAALARRRLAGLRKSLSLEDAVPPMQAQAQDGGTLLAALDDLQQSLADILAAPVPGGSEHAARRPERGR